MRTTLSIIVYVVVLLCAVSAQATMTMQTFFSDQLGEDRDILVYTPPNYSPTQPPGYPVVYLLHGANMDPSYFDDPALDLGLNLAIQFGQIEPMILVFPDGSTPDYWSGSFYVDSELYGNFEKYMIHDVLGYVDGNYNTIAEPWQRAFGGYSMGGFGAARIVSKYPDLFQVAAFVSAPLHPTALLDLIPQVIAENDPDNLGPPYTYDPANGLTTGYMFAMCGALTPDMGNNPPVQFIIDQNGELVDAVWDIWIPQFPSTWLWNYDSRFDALDLFMSVGDQDELNLLVSMQDYATMLDVMDYDYTFTIYPGIGHQLGQDQLMDGLIWVNDALEAATPAPGYIILLPYNEQIPAGGGTLSYSVNVISNLMQSVPGIYYFENVVLPNGSVYGNVFQQQFTLPAGANITVDLSLDIPAFAPLGSYWMRGNLGMNPNNAIKTSKFAWSKTAGATDAIAFAEWSHSPWPGVDFAGADDEITVKTGLPSEYAISRAYPNPFNAATTVSIQLPAASDMNVKVFNSLGQQVATLADGTYAAGQHALTFDANGLGSGVYFIRTNVPGQLNDVSKVTLLK